MKILNRMFVFLIFIIFALSVLILSANLPVWKIFLVKDWDNFNFNSLLQDDNKPSGHISYIEGSGLRRKSENDGYFQDIKLNSPVFMGDIIITDQKTKAVIVFEKNNQIEISESSIIKLDFSKNDERLVSISKMPKIEIIKGKINENGNEKVEINRDIAAIKSEIPKPQKMIISKKRMDKIFPKKNEIKKTEIKDNILEEPKVFENIELASAVVESLEIKEPKKIEIKNKKSGVYRLDTVSKIVGNSYVNSNEYKGETFDDFFVDISWNGVKHASHYLVDFYDDKGLKFDSIKTKENRYRLKKMFNGSIQYEVIAYDNSQRISVSKKDKLHFDFQSPEMKNPRNNSKLNNENSSYLFTWDKKNFTTEYLIEISENLNFDSPISKKTKDNFIQIPLKSGKYYWRVYSIHKELRSPASQPSVFTIE